MSMNQIPTLVVGIGGIGCRIAANISDLLSDEDRKYVGIVGMDTNVNDLKQLAEHKIKTIRTSDERSVREYLQQNSHYAEWFPVNRFTLDRGMVNGAGQIRAISRLAAIASEESGGFTPIKEEIKRIRQQHGDNINKNLAVIIVGSITGGTGAGIFLQLPYYIRKILRNTEGLNSIIIRGMFVGPDITAEVQPSKTNADAVRVNGYACLKELNALYMTQSQENPNLRFEYFDLEEKEAARRAAMKIRKQMRSTSDDFYGEDFDLDPELSPEDARIIAQRAAYIPYDYLYLIEGTTSAGGIGTASIPNVESQVARMAFTLMFTPVSDNALSVEDNMVLQDMETNGMNRYSSAGLCRLVYPYDTAREYVTMAMVNDLVRNEWTIIDTQYNNALVAARANQKTDGMIEMPKLIPTFKALFEKEVQDGMLGRLFKQVYIVDEMSDRREKIPRSQTFVQRIEDNVEELIEEDRIKSAIKACEPADSKMRSLESAKKEVARVERALEDFYALARNTFKEKELEIANRMFPTSWVSMDYSKKEEDNIYQMLYNVHPLAARYLLYDLILRLREKVEELESSLASLDMNAYDTEDFDVKKPGRQTPKEVLRDITDQRIPIINRAFSETGKLAAVRKKFNDTVKKQTEAIVTFLRDSITLSTCRNLLQRAEMIADNYFLFFQGLTKTINANKKKLEELENNNMPFGMVGVYCDREALRKIAEEYKSQIDTELPADTMKSVFENIYRIFASDFANENTARTERQKELYLSEKKKKLDSIFRAAVIDTIRTDVTKNGNGIVNLNIHQALMKQMELDTGYDPEYTEDYEAKAEEYIHEYLHKAMNIAFPMLAVDASTMSRNTESVYITINPDCAVIQDGKPDAGATQEHYYPQADEQSDYVRPTVLMDEEFSPYEITCFKARYKFSIEDLIKFRDSSENAVAYRRRIINLENMRNINPNDPDSCLTVVNPHINRYWHEPGFLPEISADSRQKTHEDILKAFIYAMGYDLFLRERNEDVTDANNNVRLMWLYRTPMGTSVFVKSKGVFIGNNYADIFAALPFNSKIVNMINRDARRRMQTIRGTKVANEIFETITEDSFFLDLAQPEDREDYDDNNIFDIILDMRQNMAEPEWVELFDALRITMWEYLAYMFNDNQKMVNDAYYKLLEIIYSNSTVAKKDAAKEELAYGERQVKEHYNAMLAERFIP